MQGGANLDIGEGPGMSCGSARFSDVVLFWQVPTRQNGLFAGQTYTFLPLAEGRNRGCIPPLPARAYVGVLGAGRGGAPGANWSAPGSACLTR